MFHELGTAPAIKNIDTHEIEIKICVWRGLSYPKYILMCCSKAIGTHTLCYWSLVSVYSIFKYHGPLS